MDLRRFPGVAVITGAGGHGIGAATVQAFATAGCTKIAITDINEAGLLETQESINRVHPGVRLFARAGDIADEAFVESFMDNVLQEFGRIDYGVNCAGILSSPLRSTELSLEEFDRINQVNYRGCWLSSRAQLKRMIKQDPIPMVQQNPYKPASISNRPSERGAIVNVASQLGIVGRHAAPAYCASKSAVIGMTRCDAIDYSADGIRVNCICPGVIETPMTTHSEEVKQRLQPAIEMAPMKRMGQPEEVADAILFLCSRQASFIQGHALVVDGGYVVI
ncbi:oxidoreductase [Trichoderma afarasin]